MSSQLAAIDLGSNSFHMIVARPGPGNRPLIIDRIKEPVRLAAGLDASGNITAAAADRALSCLGQFAERLTGFGPGQVRAVGTNTLRRAQNRLDFLAFLITEDFKTGHITSLFYRFSWFLANYLR